MVKKTKWKKRASPSQVLFAGEAWLLWLRGECVKQTGGGLEKIVIKIVEHVLSGDLPAGISRKSLSVARRRAQSNSSEVTR